MEHHEDDGIDSNILMILSVCLRATRSLHIIFFHYDVIKRDC